MASVVKNDFLLDPGLSRTQSKFDLPLSAIHPLPFADCNRCTTVRIFPGSHFPGHAIGDRMGLRIIEFHARPDIRPTATGVVGFKRIIMKNIDLKIPLNIALGS